MRDRLAPGGEAAPRPIDRLDPRTRIVAALAGVIAAVTIADPRLLLAAIATTAGASFFAGVEPRDLGRRLAHVEGFLAVLLVTTPFAVAGEPAFALGPFVASWAGLERVLVIAGRVGLAATIVFTLLGGLEPVRFGHGLARLGVPERLVHVFLFTVRFVDVLRGEAVRLRDALRARGFRPGASRHTLATYGDFAGMLLVRAFERAARVDEAMRCRGFAGRLMLVTGERFGVADAVFAVGWAGLLGLGFWAERLT